LFFFSIFPLEKNTSQLEKIVDEGKKKLNEVNNELNASKKKEVSGAASLSLWHLSCIILIAYY